MGCLSWICWRQPTVWWRDCTTPYTHFQFQTTSLIFCIHFFTYCTVFVTAYATLQIAASSRWNDDPMVVSPIKPARTHKSTDQYGNNIITYEGNEFIVINGYPEVQFGHLGHCKLVSPPTLSSCAFGVVLNKSLWESQSNSMWQSCETTLNILLCQNSVCLYFKSIVFTAVNYIPWKEICTLPLKVCVPLCQGYAKQGFVKSNTMSNIHSAE